MGFQAFYRGTYDLALKAFKEASRVSHFPEDAPVFRQLQRSLGLLAKGEEQRGWNSIMDWCDLKGAASESQMGRMHRRDICRKGKKAVGVGGSSMSHANEFFHHCPHTSQKFWKEIGRAHV